MAKEIERKFLVRGGAWRSGAEGVPFRQGYLNSAADRTVRVRTAGSRAFLTVKGRTSGCTRLEFEYEIPAGDAGILLDEVAERPIIEKTRFRIAAGNGLAWEVDEFHGVNEGLVVAEIELPSEDTPFEKPDWLGDEVTGDPRYYNSSLVGRPFTAWAREGEKR